VDAISLKRAAQFLPLYFMESRTTCERLAVLLKAPSEQLHVIIQTIEVPRHIDQIPVVAKDIIAPFQFASVEDLEALVLPVHKQREPELANLILNLTARRIEWLQAVRAAEWDDFTWRSTAIQIFTEAESLGISGVASFAIVAASMMLQGYRRPTELHNLLWGAKQNVARMEEEIAAAEKSQAAELKAKPTT
jgi:hypothetical protein